MSAYDDAMAADQRYTSARALGANSGAGFQVSTRRVGKETLRMVMAALIVGLVLGVLIMLGAKG